MARAVQFLWNVLPYFRTVRRAGRMTEHHGCLTVDHGAERCRMGLASWAPWHRRNSSKWSVSAAGSR